MFFVWTSLSTVQNRNLHCFTLTRKNTYYDSFSNKYRSDFFDCSHDNQGRSVIYDLIKKCSDLITKSAEKTSSTFRIIDLTFWPWRFQIIVLEKPVNKIQILNQSETKKVWRRYIFFEMIPSPGRDQRLTARVAPGINLGVVQGDSCYGENFVK